MGVKVTTLNIMSSVQAYAIRHRPESGSEKSDVELTIRAALVLRGSSLRQWAHAWARHTGRDPARAYQTVRNTLGRRLARGLPPRGPEGMACVAALRDDLGSSLVPMPSPAAADRVRERSQPGTARRSVGER